MARSCGVIAWLLLGAGCPRSGGPSTTKALTASTSAVSQQEMSRGFPGEVKFERCVQTQGGETMLDEVSPIYLTIDENRVDRLGDEYRRTEEPGGDVYRIAPSQFATNVLAYRLLDDRVYFTSTTGPVNGDDFDIQWMCIIGDDDAALRRMGLDWHYAELRAYNARRAATAQIPAEEGEGRRNNITPEQADQIARAETMTSMTIEARVTTPDSQPWVEVTAELADGTSMSIDVNDAIFDDLFRVTITTGTLAALVKVRALHDESISAEQEITYHFDIERSFVCEGKPGRSGLDNRDGSGGVAYQGEAGEPGPDITVEIASTGNQNAAGDPILYYRLTCDDRVETFRASASSRIHVATYGGAGGYAIPRPKGDGANGGNGGNGGDITVIVDPAVEDYPLTHASVGGAGGSASDPDKTNDFTEGSPGAPGSDGQVVVRRASVDLP